MASINVYEMKKVKYRQEEDYFQGDLYYKGEYIGNITRDDGEQIVTVDQGKLEKFKEICLDVIGFLDDEELETVQNPFDCFLAELINLNILEERYKQCVKEGSNVLYVFHLENGSSMLLSDNSKNPEETAELMVEEIFNKNKELPAVESFEVFDSIEKFYI